MECGVMLCRADFFKDENFVFNAFLKVHGMSDEMKQQLDEVME